MVEGIYFIYLYYRVWIC